MKAPIVFNIQKYSIHDGDGIRTSIFFKGCPERCSWCHNPESQRYDKELMFYHDRCTLCGACIKHCPNGANSITDGQLVVDRSKCNACGICTDWCLSGAREIAGREYTVDELVREAMKDRMFYEDSGGGVTLSGGEVMVMDMDYIEELCRKLYDKGISVYIDTSGYAPYENFKRLLPYVNTFLYDMKIMDNELHKEYIGVDTDTILENMKKLSEDGARIYARLPIIGNVNATEEHIMAAISFLKENSVSVAQVNLLPYHNTGSGKYNKLDRDYDSESMTVPDKDLMEHFRQLFIINGFQNTKIGG